MPRFDMPGRDGETRRIVMHPDGRERVFPLPYETEDPREIRMLTRHGCIVVPPKPRPVTPHPPVPDPPPPVAEPKPKPHKGGDA